MDASLHPCYRNPTAQTLIEHLRKHPHSHVRKFGCLCVCVCDVMFKDPLSFVKTNKLTPVIYMLDLSQHREKGPYA